MTRDLSLLVLGALGTVACGAAIHFARRARHWKQRADYWLSCCTELQYDQYRPLRTDLHPRFHATRAYPSIAALITASGGSARTAKEDER